ncbi:hypothetical protein HYT57_04815 [Candidatus Woesearchaeota archaeon]|nr:hypothetical protein [Candidatus Woesearchaeota archaeon]
MTYRNKLESQKGISLSGGYCIVCGWGKNNHKGNSLVIGSHVRKFNNILDYDKRDNIIGLCPNHHVEFDAGNITIDTRNGVCIHIDNKDSFHNKKIVGKIDHIKTGYFDYHKKSIFKGRN